MEEQERYKDGIGNSRPKFDIQNEVKDTPKADQLTEEGLRELINAVRESVKEDRDRHERGDLFNEFIAAKFDENRHSNFIASLLDPSGAHGMEDRFLKSFLDNVYCLKDFDFNTKTAIVMTERQFNAKKRQGKGYRRNDITITSKDRIIIIENKIKEAKDLKEQLVDYYDYGENYTECRLLYLTASKKMIPDKCSTNKEGSKLRAYEHYYPINCVTEVIPWLEKCAMMAKSSSKDHLCKEIEQYIGCLKWWCEVNTESDAHHALLDTMMKSSYIDYVAAIGNVMDEWVEQRVKKHLEPLLDRIKRDLKDKGIKLRKFLNMQNHRKCHFYFYKEQWTNTYINFGFDRDWAYYGIECKKSDVPAKEIYSLPYKDPSYPFGYNWLSSYPSIYYLIIPDGNVQVNVVKEIESCVITILNEFDEGSFKNL